jgi:prepilin-type processing-associated H-X9-DG protein
MTIDIEKLSGGLAAEKDLVLPGKPQDPEMRESVSVWLFEDGGAFAMPRTGIEAEGSSWDDRRLQANFAFADGRVLNGAGRGPAPSAIGPDGRPTVIGAGALTFRCIEPFRRWTVTFDGPALDGHVSEQIDGRFKTKTPVPTQVRLEAEMTMATPAWVQEVSGDISTMTEKEAANAQAMGLGYRFEHHFRAHGVLTIDGKTRDFKGSGTRIHRQSIRRLEGFTGHCWLSALFPDGRAFGCLAYPPLAGKSEYSYNDAVIYQDGRMIPARILKAPFLRRIVDRGDDVSVELQSELGTTRIKGVTALSTFRIGNPDIGGLNLQQGGALFTWDGQSAYGMVERSSHESLTTIG